MPRRTAASTKRRSGGDAFTNRLVDLYRSVLEAAASRHSSSSSPSRGLKPRGSRKPTGTRERAQETREKSVDMVVAMYGDFALYGVSADEGAESPRYWMSLRLDNEPFALFHAKVSGPLFRKLVHDEFGDGYRAWSAVSRYVKPKRPFYVSHSYSPRFGAYSKG